MSSSTLRWFFFHLWLDPRDTSSCCMVNVPQPRSTHKALQIWGGFVIYFCEGRSSWKFTKCMKNMQWESSEKLNSPTYLGDLYWSPSDSAATSWTPSGCWGKARSARSSLRKRQPRLGQRPGKPHSSCAQAVNAFRVVYGMHHRKNHKVGTGSCSLGCFSLVAASCRPIFGSQQRDESHNGFRK